MADVVAKGTSHDWYNLCDEHGDPLRDHTGDNTCVLRKFSCVCIYIYICVCVCVCVCLVAMYVCVS